MPRTKRWKPCRLAWVLCVAAVFSPASTRAEVRRALLIGINVYLPDATSGQLATDSRAGTAGVSGRGWFNLDGAVNDVKEIQEILVARYGFERKNIRTLTDAAATREGILRAFREHLIRDAKKGDVCVFFYSGHGSQLESSMRLERDRKDETIVPVDANRGAPDIRDKDLSRLFNDLLDKSAVLTVFLDSCHSGSLSRGLGTAGKVRYLAPAPQGAAAPAAVEDPRGAPSDRGALIFSASQDRQKAQETVDGQGVPHGAFTVALAKALRTMPTDEPAEYVFRRVRAIVQAEGLLQEPTQEGTPARLSGPLFGAAAGQDAPFRVAVQEVRNGDKCILDGGRAAGLCVGAELRTVEGATKVGKPVRVRVVSTPELDRSNAQIVEGAAADLAPGDLLELERWSGCDEPFLRMWMPPATLPQAALLQLARDLEPLRTTPGERWIDDPSEEPPTHVLTWNGSDWQLVDSRHGSAQSMGKSPQPAAILEQLRKSPADTTRFFLYLPPASELAPRFGFAPRDAKNPVELAATPSGAHYWLVGRRLGKALEYAWLLPNVSRVAAETSYPLPARSDWCALGNAPAAADTTVMHLQSLALRIGKIRMWLQLEPPPDEGRFPYRLAFVNPTTGKIASRPTVYVGETFRLALVGGQGRPRYGVRKRYAYVFAIDSHGEMKPVFPIWNNEGNYLPATDTPGAKPDSLIVLGQSAIVVSEPYGIDAYFLLTTATPLPDLNVLRSRPVRTRGAPDRGEPQDPLSKLLAGVSSGTRGMKTPTPVDWSLQRLLVRSAPRGSD